MPAIVYNSYTIPDVTGKFHFSESYTSASLSCTFFIYAASSALLVAACATAEVALRQWNKDLTLSFGGTAEYSFSHSGDTGFLAQPTLTKLGGQIDTGTRRGYKFDLKISLPANQTGYDYRRSGKIQYDSAPPARVTCTVSGEYTAGVVTATPKSAKENYDTYGPTWANSIATSLLGNYELMHCNINYEQENKILSFSRQYREKLTISTIYNGYTIPNTYSKFTISESYTNLSFSCEFALSVANSAAAETALRVYNADMTMSFDGVAQYSYKHSDNTGLLTIPHLEMISDVSEHDALRFYRFSLTCQLPANKSGYGYRREGSYTITYDGSRRKRASFACVYTAGTGTASRANYTSGAKTWATGILTAIGGTYELVSENSHTEHEDKITNGSLIYQEILSKETENSTNYAKIVDANCDISVDFGQELGVSTGGYTQTAPVTVSVHYTAKVDQEQAGSDTNIEEVYRTYVRPWIIKHAYSVLGLANWSQASTNYIAENEGFSISPTGYHVSGSLSFSCPRSTSQIVKLSETLQEHTQSGLVYRKLWDSKPNTFNMYNVGGQKTLRRSITIMQIGTPPADPVPYVGTPDKWVRLDIQKNYEEKLIGVGSRGSNVSTQLQSSTYYIVSFSENYLFVEESL